MSHDRTESEQLTLQNEAEDAGGRPSGSLTIELPTKPESDESGGDDYSDENMSDSERARIEAGFNSPKGPDADDVPTYGDDDEDAGDASPEMRDKMGVNSPRRSQIEKRGWDIPDEDNKDEAGAEEASGPPPGFITQVSRDDPNNNPITSVPQYDDDDDPPARSQRDTDDTDSEIRRVSQRGSSWFGCCSFLNCARQEEPVDDEEPTERNPNRGPPVQQQAPEPVGVPSTETGLVPGSPGPNGSIVGYEPVVEFPDAYYNDGLLPRPLAQHKTQKCLVLDLDETLVHSSFKPVPNADFIIPVEIDGVIHRVYVMKRPYVDEFLARCAKMYEIVVFTASLAKYANPLLDQLDPNGTVTYRLFRESCVIHQTAYVKDLTRLARQISKTIIVDNSAQSYLFQPKNAIPIPSWFDDMSDTLLLDLLPVLETTMFEIPDVRKLLDAHTKSYRWLCNQANKTAVYS